MLAPEGHLFGDIGEREEGAHHPRSPAHQRKEHASDLHGPFDVPGFDGAPAGAPLGVGKLNGIDVTCDDVVLIGEPGVLERTGRARGTRYVLRYRGG